MACWLIRLRDHVLSSRFPTQIETEENFIRESTALSAMLGIAHRSCRAERISISRLFPNTFPMRLSIAVEARRRRNSLLLRGSFLHFLVLLSPQDSSEEMYSLDNDSFLTSLEAMTIPTYWTETIKHTKL